MTSSGPRETPHLLVIGLGYTAQRVAGRLGKLGWRVTGTARSPAGAAKICERGWRGIVFDGAGPSAELAAAIAEATHILVSAPPGEYGDPALAMHGHDLAVAARDRLLEAVVYLSTIGVYGDHQGRWIDEATRVAPGSPRARRRVEAELAWLALDNRPDEGADQGGSGVSCASRAGARVVVLRLPGIYGPGRSAIDQLRAGTARRIVKPGQVFNRAHVDDIATAAVAALTRPAPGRVYNVTDDEPSPPQDVVAFAADLLGVPPPPEVPFEAADLSPMGRSFYGETKRVANGRMKSELGVTQAYPTYREGLEAIAARGARATS
jgi:nucleoside-diphosphate-sugar epimerase